MSSEGKSRLRGAKAWLIRWEWTGEHANVDEPIIAILSPHLGARDIRTFVERFYASVTYEPGEKVQFMRRPKENPYQAVFGTVTITEADGRSQQIPWDGEITCGHNPYIVATLVSNLREQDPGNPTSALLWENAPRPQHDLRTRKSGMGD